MSRVLKMYAVTVMKVEVEIGNVRRLTFPKDGTPNIYCGRGRAPGGTIPAQLGNPFIVGRDGNRGECCALYRESMRRGSPFAHVQTIKRMAAWIVEKKHKRVILLCWCAPAPCHCETIREHLLSEIELRTG